MKIKLLVTGHTGFIGSALTVVLRGNNRFEVVGVSRSVGQDLVSFDLKSLTGVDVVIHLAGSVGVLQSWAKPFETFQNNILPTLRVLEFARAHKARLIFMSSYIYGEPEYLPIDESHPIKCRNPYAESKRLAEILCEAYARDFGLSVTILRPFNVYGPGQARDRLIPYVIHQAKEKSSICVKDLRPKRDYLYIDDLVDAIMKVICSEQHGLGIFNLGLSKSYSVRDVIDVVLKVVGRRVAVHSTKEYRPNEIMDCYSNSNKFAAQFGWAPQVSLIGGIAKLLQSS